MNLAAGDDWHRRNAESSDADSFNNNVWRSDRALKAVEFNLARGSGIRLLATPPDFATLTRCHRALSLIVKAKGSRYLYSQKFA